MNSLLVLVDWNADAVELMKEGRSDEAAAIIKMALRCLKTHLETNMEDFQHRNPDPPCNYELITKEKDPNAIISSVDITAIEEVQNYQTSTNLFNFYSKAFKANGNRMDLLTAPKIMVVLLYNLALLYHINAMRRFDDTQHSRLRDVVQMYHTAMQVASAYWEQDDLESIAWVLLAIATNRGHIYSECLNFQETRDSLSNFGALLDMIPWSSQRTIPLEEYKAFLENVYIFMELSGLNVSPAA